jgi:hypothetical protein
MARPTAALSHAPPRRVRSAGRRQQFVQPAEITEQPASGFHVTSVHARDLPHRMRLIEDVPQNVNFATKASAVWQGPQPPTGPIAGRHRLPWAVRSGALAARRHRPAV